MAYTTPLSFADLGDGISSDDLDAEVGGDEGLPGEETAPILPEEEVVVPKEEEEY